MRLRLLARDDAPDVTTWRFRCLACRAEVVVAAWRGDGPVDERAPSHQCVAREAA